MAMRKRWVVPTPTESDDEQLLMALRPQRLDEYIGQRTVVERLRIALDAAKQRGEPLEHTPVSYTHLTLPTKRIV